MSNESYQHNVMARDWKPVETPPNPLSECLLVRAVAIALGAFVVACPLALGAYGWWLGL